jgi:hypothetical protein
MSLSADLLAQINGQITARTNRQTLIQAVLNGLDAVVTELVALDADGYPALLATSVVGSIFSELQEENADLDPAVAIGIAAEQRAISLLRGFIGQAAAVCPWLTWNALPFPYGNDAGMQSIREIQYDLTQLGGENAAIVLTNSADINPMGATINADGTTTGGDYWHANTPDLPKLGIRAPALAASAILASSGGRHDIRIPGRDDGVWRPADYPRLPAECIDIRPDDHPRHRQ